MTRKYRSFICAFLGLILLVAPLVLAAPDSVNYQGRLTDSSGQAITTSQSVQFRVYDALVGGTLLWAEDQTLIVDSSGIFQVELGQGTTLVGSFDRDLFFDDDRWLEVVVAGEALSPRQRFTSAAYALQASDAINAGNALQADNADTLDTLDSTAFVLKGEASVITSAMVSDNALTAADLATDSVTASEIAAGAVGTSEIADDSVTAADLAAGSVGTSEVINNSLTASDLAANSVGASEIAAGAVGSSEIADGSITSADLDKESVGSDAIIDGSIKANDLADDYVNTSGDTMTGDLTINADLNVSGSSTSSSDYVATFESSGGPYAYALKGIANSANFSARGLLLDVDSPNSTAYGAYVDVDAPNSEARGLDLSVNCRGTNCIEVDSGAYSTEGIAQGMRINATNGVASTQGVLGINANVIQYGTGYLHGIDIDANHSGASGESNGIHVDLTASDIGDATGIYAEANKLATDTSGTTYGGHFIGNNDRWGGNSYGGYGEAECVYGRCYGLYGKATKTDNTSDNYGLYGEAASASSEASVCGPAFTRAQPLPSMVMPGTFPQHVIHPIIINLPESLHMSSIAEHPVPPMEYIALSIQVIAATLMGSMQMPIPSSPRVMPMQDTLWAMCMSVGL